MITGHKDTDRLVLLAIDSEKDFLTTCLSSPDLSQLCDSTLIENRIRKYYPASLKHRTSQSVKRFYWTLVQYIDKLKDEYDFDATHAVDPIDYYLILSAKKFIYGKIREAIKNNYTDLAIFLTDGYIKSKSKDSTHTRAFSEFLLLAAEHGNKDLINYYLFELDFNTLHGWDTLAFTAAQNGHSDIAAYLRNLKTLKNK